MRRLPLLLILLASWGCRQNQVIMCKPNEAYDSKLKQCYPCPAGTKVDHGSATCVPVGGDVVTPSDGHLPSDSAPTDGTGETALPDSRTAETLNELGPDLPPADTVAPGEIGADCKLDADCKGEGTCFDWPGGYCTELGCQSDDDCPDGSGCLPLLENGTGCFDSCVTTVDCRQGYGCKGIPNGAGGTASICYPLGSEELPAGSPCEQHGECAENMSCVHQGSGFQCTQVGCGLEIPCIEEYTCVWLGWVSACLPTCEGDIDCGGGLICDDFDGMEGKEVSACTTPSIGLPIGNLCFFDSECKSGYCHLMVLGKCSDSGAPCASDEGCTQGVCVVDPTAQRGVCSDFCSINDFCEEGFCVFLGGASPVCVPSCGGWNDPCGPEDLGLSCIYGDPLAPPASGKYACGQVIPGLGGSGCEGDLQCASGACYRPEGEPGYCATSCGLGADCPFGSICKNKDQVWMCLKRCASDLDCPDKFTCTSTTYSAEKICVTNEEL
jgi:hypothetical protein